MRSSGRKRSKARPIASLSTIWSISDRPWTFCPGSGRGLSALLPSTPAQPASERVRTYFAAQIEDVYPAPDQPRRRFPDAELEQLAASIKSHGVIMPLVVRPRRDGGYTLIAGETTGSCRNYRTQPIGRCLSAMS